MAVEHPEVRVSVVTFALECSESIRVGLDNSVDWTVVIITGYFYLRTGGRRHALLRRRQTPWGNPTALWRSSLWGSVMYSRLATSLWRRFRLPTRGGWPPMGSSGFYRPDRWTPCRSDRRGADLSWTLWIKWIVLVIVFLVLQIPLVVPLSVFFLVF